MLIHQSLYCIFHFWSRLQHLRYLDAMINVYDAEYVILFLDDPLVLEHPLEKLSQHDSHHLGVVCEHVLVLEEERVLLELKLSDPVVVGVRDVCSLVQPLSQLVDVDVLHV